MKSSKNTHVMQQGGRDMEHRKQSGLPEHEDHFREFKDIEEDFNTTYEVQGKAISRMGLQIEIRTTSEMSESSLKRAKSTIRKTLKAFEEEFGELPATKETRKVTLYLFDDKDSLANSMEEMGHERSSSGVCWPDLGKIYAAQVGKNKVANLAHELTHQLEYYATGGLHVRNEATRFLGEGVADYIQYVVENRKKVNLDFMGKAEGVLELIYSDAELREARSVSELAAIVGARKIQQGQLKSFFRDVEKRHVSTVDEVLDVLKGYKVTIKDNDYARLRSAENADEALSIIKEYGDSNRYEKLTYGMNRAIVKYLQENKPGIIAEAFKNSLKASQERELLGADASFEVALPAGINALTDEFMYWLSDHTIADFSNNHEMLSVVQGEKIGYTNIIADGKVRKSEVFTAKLKDKYHEEVGVLSPVEHVTNKGIITVNNQNTSDLIRVDSKYYNIKAVDTSDGVRYVYCDSEGREHFRSLDDPVINGVSEVLGKYNSNFADMRGLLHEIHWSYLDYFAAMDAQTQHVLFTNIENMYVLLKKSIQNIEDVRYKTFVEIDGFANAKLGTDVSHAEIRDVISAIQGAYKVYTSETVQALITRPDPNMEESEMLGRILKSLIYIDPNMIVGVGKDSFDKHISKHPGEIVHLEATGKGDLSAVSAYLGDQKIGELPSSVGVYTKYNDDYGHAVERFIVSNALKSIHTVYPGSPLVVVTKDPSGGKVVNLISGVEADNAHSEEAQVEVNKFLDLVSKGTGYSDSFPISKGISIVTHDDRKNAQLDSDKAYAIKGAKVEDRGTEDLSDDRYEAYVKMGDKVLIQRLATRDFHISECKKDAQGNVIDAPNLYIRDMATDKRFQFPDSITHIKLIRDDAGREFLVPCTKDGNTNPYGMPDDVGQYAYIDPIFAYERMDIDRVSRHAQFKLIDFSKYETGKKFKVAPDINDPTVHKDGNGDPLRTGPSNTYVTRVMIIDEASGKKIGELAGAPTFFQGDVFLSFDFSYSSNDFLSSLYHQEAEVVDAGKGIKKVAFTGEGDLGTDSGYSLYHSFYQRAEERPHQQNIVPETRGEMREDRQQATTSDLSQDTGDTQRDAGRRAEERPHQQNIVPETRGEMREDRQQATTSDLSQTSKANSEYMEQYDNRSRSCGSSDEVKVYRDITYSESTILGDVAISMRVTGHKVIDGKDVPVYSLVIFQSSTGKYVQFPEEITHMKVVTLGSIKYLTPCAANGYENPGKMPSNMTEQQKYIKPIFVHEDVLSQGYGNDAVLALLDLTQYADETLFEMRPTGEKIYSTTNITHTAGDAATVHLFLGNTEVGILSGNTGTSYSGLLASPRGVAHFVAECVSESTNVEHATQRTVELSPEEANAHNLRAVMMYVQIGESPDDLNDDHAQHHSGVPNEYFPNTGNGAADILGFGA